MGNKVKDIPGNIYLYDLSYDNIPDPIRVPNDNANLLFSLCCENNLAIVNNARKGELKFDGKLTFKKGTVWTSELDLCIVSPNLIQQFQHFDIIQDLSLPSDHAPVSFTLKMNLCLDALLEQANFLGDHAVLYSNIKRNVCKKAVKFSSINPNLFCGKLAQHDLPGEDLELDTSIQSMCDILYKCASDSKVIQQPLVQDDQDMNSTSSRWDRLLQEKNDKNVWAAINWKGEYNVNYSTESNCPSDEQFKDFFEEAIELR